jgi:predicted Zn-ribbon and HTH transcriptional regulator
MTATPLTSPLLHSNKAINVTQYRYVIRDHKGNPYSATASNPAEACKQLDLNPRNCTVEVLDTSVDYQKWDEVERQELLNVKNILKTHNRIPSKDIHPFTRTLARQAKVNPEGFLPDKPSICPICGFEFEIAHKASGHPKHFCSNKCRQQSYRNGKT